MLQFDVSIKSPPIVSYLQKMDSPVTLKHGQSRLMCIMCMVRIIRLRKNIVNGTEHTLNDEKSQCSAIDNCCFIIVQCQGMEKRERRL